MFASISSRYRRILSAAATLSLLASAMAPVASTVHAAAGSELFFSEYIEGSSNNKALEIYNPTDNAINLSASAVPPEILFNGKHCQHMRSR